METSGDRPLSVPQNVTISEAKDISGFSYYEYKYLVEHQYFSQVKSLLDEFYGHSDPFPAGIVDSIYYDTRDQFFLSQCLDGEEFKSKFRIRGYGDGKYNQAHHKMKQLSGVSKFKAKVIPCSADRECAPLWDDLTALAPNDRHFSKIRFNASKHGILFPSVRIQYVRFRYRSYDYRITFDTNIEAFAPINGLPSLRSHASLNQHVLEIKTTRLRPKLPFVGLMKLPQVSFSKFMLGLIELNK